MPVIGRSMKPLWSFTVCTFIKSATNMLYNGRFHCNHIRPVVKLCIMVQRAMIVTLSEEIGASTALNYCDELIGTTLSLDLISVATPLTQHCSKLSIFCDTATTSKLSCTWSLCHVCFPGKQIHVDLLHFSIISSLTLLVAYRCVEAHSDNLWTFSDLILPL